MSLSSIFSRERPAVSKISKQCYLRRNFGKAKMPVFSWKHFACFCPGPGNCPGQILTDGYVSTEVHSFNCHTWTIGLIGLIGPSTGRHMHRPPSASFRRGLAEWAQPNKTLPKCCFVQSIMALFEIVSLVSFVSFRFFKMIGEMEVALLKMSDFF